MKYEIIPLELGSIVEREIYQKGNKQIKCGIVWKLGSVATQIKPKFIRIYTIGVVSPAIWLECLFCLQQFIAALML